MSQFIAVFVSVLLVCQAMANESDFMIDSKEEAQNRHVRRSDTFNMSYPNGPTTTFSPTTFEPTTSTTPTCAPCSTTSGESSSCNSNTAWLLVYILTPILTVVGFVSGVVVGACVAKCKGRTNAVVGQAGV